MAHFDIIRLSLIWKVCLLLCTAHHSVATVWDNNLDSLTGSQDSLSFSSNHFAPSSSGTGDDSSMSIFPPSSGNAIPKEEVNDNDQGNEVALDPQTNGNREAGPEEPKILLSEGKGCRPRFNQAPPQEHRRRMRREEEGKACLSDYPIDSPGTNDWSQPSSKNHPSTSTPSSEDSQDTTTTGEAGAEGGQALDKEPAISQSPPAADPFRCPYLDRPIPVCGSYIWARNAISPYTLPSCTPSMFPFPLPRSFLPY